MKRLLIPLVLLVMMLCTSCVSMSTYETLRSKYAVLELENQNLSKQVEDLQVVVDKLATPEPTQPPSAEATTALSDIIVTLYEPNSADGVDISVSSCNNTERTIKYITYIVTPYNAVNDQVWCEIRNESTSRLKLTGPGEPFEKMHGTWETVWYNPTVASCVLQEIEIEYTDGTTIDIPSSAIESIGVNYKHAESKY